MMYYNKELIEAGIDEVARGCLAGPVVASSVILPKELDDDYQFIYKDLKDSKKLTKKKRDYLKDIIEEIALDFSVSFIDNNKIDEINILNASQLAMRESIKNLNIKPEFLLIDGNYFQPYFDENNKIIPYECFIKGDSKFKSISCASILAKVYHDNYIEKIIDENKELVKYDWQNNMCYGTQKHMESIKKYGISKYHRKTFGICKDYN
jgi:ribonuclease HII